MFVRILTLATLILTLAVAGCGGGEETATTEETAEPTPTVNTEEPATDETPADPGVAPETDPASAGREVFVSTCGGCHILEDAGTSGRVGPTLDDVEPTEEEVLAAIASGPGTMPENLLEGEQAQVVAEYVAGATAE